MFSDIIVESISSGKELKEFRDKLLAASKAEGEAAASESTREAVGEDGLILVGKFHSPESA
jgi:hypothetical protein